MPLPEWSRPFAGQYRWCFGFFARLIGLGDVATPIRNIVTRVRTVIDSAIERVIGWIAGVGRRVLAAVRGGKRHPEALNGANAPAQDDAPPCLQ